MTIYPAHHTYNIQLSENVFQSNLFISKFSIAAPTSRCSKKPRRLTTTRRGNRQSLRATEEPPVRQSAVPMGLHLPQDAQAWLVGRSKCQVTKGRRPRMLMSFRDCLELHKLTVFSADAAERHWFYIQQAVCKPRRATVQQHILWMGLLNDHVRHLPTLKDSPKAVPMMKKEKPFRQGWSSCNYAGVWTNVVAEPVQPQPLNGSQVNSYLATRSWGCWVSHGWGA